MKDECSTRRNLWSEDWVGEIYILMGSIFVTRKQKSGSGTGGGGVTVRWVCVLCASCFFLGVFVIDGYSSFFFFSANATTLYSDSCFLFVLGFFVCIFHLRFLGIDEDVDSSTFYSPTSLNHGLRNVAPKIICRRKNKVFWKKYRSNYIHSCGPAHMTTFQQLTFFLFFHKITQVSKTRDVIQ